MSTKVVFHSGLQKSDPHKRSILILGQLRHLTELKFDDVKCKLEPRVSEETFKLAISTLNRSSTDSCSLYLNLATVAALPVKCSRHNTPSRAHAITRIVQAASVGTDKCIVIACERSDVYASACAVVRAFPLYSKKTSTSNDEITSTISVEFIIMPKNEFSENNPFEQPCLTLQEISALEEAAVGIRMAARIVDTPCNEMSVDDFLEEVISVGKLLNITPTIIRDKELAEKGFGGIYGVGKGASIPPALAVLSHTPETAQKTIAWVGKGIVYDTGGLSLTKTSVPGMKRDCGGAAGILGAFYALVKAEFTQNLHAVFCLADNSIGPNATKPDDIHTLYSGRTVEINNTDAEGRLVLADGVVFAQRDLKADVILDMATLTGAQAISTGKYHAAVMTNSGNWEDVILKSGIRSGDLVFPIPYCPEMHFSEFSSSVADMKNSVADRRNAQSSCAGLFIAAHLKFDFPGIWIHVDMASPVHSGERATGYGVALLSTLFGSYSKQTLLQSIAPELEALSENVAKKPRKY